MRGNAQGEDGVRQQTPVTNDVTAQAPTGRAQGLSPSLSGDGQAGSATIETSIATMTTSFTTTDTVETCTPCLFLASTIPRDTCVMH